MKIIRISLHHIIMPLEKSFETSFGTEYDRQAVIVELVGEGSVTGWGECVASGDPYYSYETAEMAWHVMTKYFVPAVLGKDLDEPETVLEWISHVRGHNMAKAAFDQAAWDLISKRDGISFAERLAAPYPEGPRERVEVGVSIGIHEDIYDAMETMEGYYMGGYKRFKLKIKPGYDIPLLKKAREFFPDERIMVDANSAYTLDDLSLLKEMDAFNLLMMEQPLGYRDIYEHSLLRGQINTPLCLDESITSYEQAQAALALNACDIINIKPSRVGGWTIARQIHDLCVEAGVDLWVGGMLETGIGRAGQLALASLPGFTLPGDISATKRYFLSDIATEFKLNSEDSTITVPTGPGLGIDVNDVQIAKSTIKMKSFRLKD